MVSYSMCPCQHAYYLWWLISSMNYEEKANFKVKRCLRISKELQEKQKQKKCCKVKWVERIDL